MLEVGREEILTRLVLSMSLPEGFMAIGAQESIIWILSIGLGEGRSTGVHDE